MDYPFTFADGQVLGGGDLQAQFDAVGDNADSRTRYLGAWSSSTAYLANDAVSYSGSKWLALVDNTNVTPAEGATWTALGGSATVADASATVKGISKLSTAPASSSNPIAVGDNDTRMTNARTPTAHASTHTNGTDDIQLATDSQKGLLSAADHTSYAAHVAAAAPHSGHLKTDGSNAMAADGDAGGFQWKNLADGTDPTDAATVQQVDAVASGYIDLQNAKAMATTNITLSGTQTLDGVSCVADDRALLTGQTTQSENGPWLVKAGAWDRPLDFDTGDTPTAGTRIFVTFGTSYHGTSWTLLTAGATVDTDPLAWTQTGAGGSGETNTASNGNSEGVGVYDSKTGVNLVMRGIVSTNALLTAAYNAGTKAIRLTVNEAAFTLNNLLGTLLSTKGGTGHSTTTPGDTLTGGAANAWDIVPGNTTTTPMYYRQTGDGVDSAAPEWTAIDAADLPVMGASGAGHAPGVVGDPGATPGISRYWREDATWGDPVIAAGAGDMAKSVYDTDNDGKVNEAELADAVPWSGVSSKPTTISGYGITDAQGLDSDLTTIAGLTPTNDDVIQRKAGAWTNRTPAQLKTDLAIAESDVSGLVSDLAAKAPLASPTFTGTPAVPTASAGTNTTQAASTAFVTAAVAAGGGGSGATVDASFTAGEALAIRQAVYVELSSAAGTAGRVYLMDADYLAKSTSAWFVGFTTAAASGGAAATVRMVGVLGSFSGLTAGATYYASATSGDITTTAPANARVVGVAISTTEILINSRPINDAVFRTVAGGTKGYFAGGSTGSDSAVTDKIVFSTDTTSAQSSANLSGARSYNFGVSDGSTKGYFAGGATSVVTADKLVYSTDTTATSSSSNLSAARGRGASVSERSTKGYFVGGYNGSANVATADKVVFSTDTTSAISSANASAARRYFAGLSEGLTKGYVAGGYTATEVAITDKITFATDTTVAQVSANLSAARLGVMGVSNGSNYGYVCGGLIGSTAQATTDRIVFATDVTAVLTTAALSTAKLDGGALSQGPDKAYFGGGHTTTAVATTSKLNLLTEICAAQTSANLSLAREAVTGISDVGL